MLNNKFTIGNFVYYSIFSSVLIGLIVGACRAFYANRKEEKERLKEKEFKIDFENKWNSYFNCESGVITKKEKDVI